MANPDIVANWGGTLKYCAGALAVRYKELGGEVIYSGKPERAIYEVAFGAIERAAGEAIAPKDILAIGDGPATDILGANRLDIDVLFIAGKGGIHQGAFDPVALSGLLARDNLRAIGVAEALAW